MSEIQIVGVLGGMSSQSTSEYYRLIDDSISDARGGHAAGEYLARAATQLEAAGADFVVMATNTIHKVAPMIRAALTVPFVHIVDVAADAISAAGIIFEELTNGVVRAESRDTHLAVIDELCSAGGDGLVLACMESELFVEQDDRPDVPIFDTTALQAERAVELSLGARTDANLITE
ncbi:aspartate racemase [Natrialba chahannaoensis JCM 10990]|uniref:Aspartate racemase n=1 Tax=Natrialba chahannaoensis JCM 10990 TaxID=1227492 RepID=M0B479_9EURY|nr:aspartate/glutamate racemase family protein [Natrialba chahannaoensis]ELZ05038.1 aspartate racemase [Natrialba chahannaoensis JCM 10990]